jgi:hypothetical protein
MARERSSRAAYNRRCLSFFQVVRQTPTTKGIRLQFFACRQVSYGHFLGESSSKPVGQWGGALVGKAIGARFRHECLRIPLAD